MTVNKWSSVFATYVLIKVVFVCKYLASVSVDCEWGRFCSVRPECRWNVPMLKQSRCIWCYLKASSDLKIDECNILELEINDHTSANSFADSSTTILWPAKAQDIAAPIPLKPAPTMMILNLELSGTWKTKLVSNRSLNDDKVSLTIVNKLFSYD